MNRTKHKLFHIAVCFLALFFLWTIMVRHIDVKPIGPRNSSVGFATLNNYIHTRIGVNMTLYTITDWLGLVPVAFMFGFAILGLVQWIKRKHILKVDYSILALGVFYILVFTGYVIFETYVVNYRPVLINGYLEASYPSSTTLLVMCVMPTAIMQFHARITTRLIRYCIQILIIAFILFMVIGRLVSGVHWITDIIGGALFSVGLVTLYYAAIQPN